METTIKEKVSVLSLYDKKTNRFTLEKISWREKIYNIKKISYHHQTREGRDLFHFFAVTTGDVDLLLKFNTQNLEWILEKISDGNAF